MLRRIAQGLGALGMLSGGAFATAWWTASPDMGAVAEGARRDRMEQSPQWRGDAFDNVLPQVDGGVLQILEKQLFGDDAVQVPTAKIPVQTRSPADFETAPASGLRVTWLGHSTLLVEQDGARILIDPVWGDRASPWTSLGPERFFAPPLALDALPDVHAIVISHDHYDHLDVGTVMALADRPIEWLVPLGVGAHLELWGVPVAQIHELDWWQSKTVAGVEITATPARHFSGRWLDRIRSTLWSGWALRGPQHRVYYSGDTALFPELADIGARLGPFDLTMIEAGAYDSTWTDVHLGPEQAVVAHQMVQGNVMIPVHWGMFDLANHAWTEPLERVLVAAERQGVSVRMPPPGGSVELGDAQGPQWWPDVPVRTVQGDPVWSTAVDGVLDQWWPGTR